MKKFKYYFFSSLTIDEDTFIFAKISLTVLLNCPCIIRANAILFGHIHANHQSIEK